MAKRKRPTPRKKPGRKTASNSPTKRKKALRKRDAFGRFLPNPKRRPTKRKKVGKKRKRRLSAKSNSPVRLRDSRGRFIKMPKPERHWDGRRNDPIRPIRVRMTFDQAIDAYEFKPDQIPDWVTYLAGAP